MRVFLAFLLGALFSGVAATFYVMEATHPAQFGQCETISGGAPR